MRSLFPILFVSWVLGCLLVPSTGSTQSTTPGDETLARARQLYTEGGPVAALPVYNEALTLYRANGERLGEAITLGLIGNCQKRLGNYEQALELLDQALIMKRELGNLLEEGKTLSHLGLVYWELADYDSAIRYLEQALAIGREVDDAKLQGASLNNLSLVYDELGDYQRSLEQYRQALKLFRSTDSPEAESYVLGNMGGVHLLLGQFREAMNYYEQALEISERLEAKPSMSQDLGNLASCHLGLGEIPEALAKLDRALALARETGLAREEANWLKGKGDVLLDVGRHSEGLDLYQQALVIYESAGNKRELAESLNELAALYLQLGDLSAAEEYLERSLELAREIDFRRGVVVDLVALGELEWRRQRYDEAAKYLQEALQSVTETEQDLAAMCRTQLAFNLRDQGKTAQALAEALQGLELAEALDSKLQQAEALFAVGDIELRQEKATAALVRFEQGKRLVQELGEPDIAWRLAHGQGRALEALGRPSEAVIAYKEAVKLIETVRGRLLQERLRAGYIEDKQEVYVDLARLLVTLERQEEAFSYAEKLRARSYLSLLSSEPIPRLTEDQRRREIELRQRVRRLQQSLDEELDPAYEPRRQAMEIFAVELSQAEEEYETFLSGLRILDPELAATWTLSVPDAAEIRETLPPNSILLEFVVGNDEVLVFGLSHDQLRTHVASVARKDLRAKVELLRELIRRRESTDWLYPATSLASILMDPLETAGWFEGATRLYLVPHDILHYLPFAVLPYGQPQSSLILDFQLSYLPSAGSLVLSRPGSPRTDGLLALAPQNARLRHTEAEVHTVAKALEGEHKVLTGTEATEKAFKTLAGQYRVLHLATHAYWNRLNPLLSGLELEPGSGEDGRLEVHEILDLRLAADFVTLSACETALGSGFRGTTPVGDDFVGLTRAFLHAGSDGVVASLWEVDDESTLDLMRRFYSELSHHTPTAALAEAQRAMLNDGGPQDPYLWAAFVVVGALEGNRE